MFDKAVTAIFRKVDDLAAVWCEYIEMELRHRCGAGVGLCVATKESLSGVGSSSLDWLALAFCVLLHQGCFCLAPFSTPSSVTLQPIKARAESCETGDDPVSRRSRR